METCDKILKCGNSYYVHESDKKNLVKYQNPLERNMLRYLLLFDQEILDFKFKQQEVAIFMRPFFIGFGLLQLT